MSGEVTDDRMTQAAAALMDGEWPFSEAFFIEVVPYGDGVDAENVLSRAIAAVASADDPFPACDNEGSA